MGIKYDPKFKAEVDIYIDECKTKNTLPSIEGFAQRIGTDTDSIWAWANKPAKNKETSEIIPNKLARPQFLAQVNKLKKLEEVKPEESIRKGVKTKNYSAKEITEKKKNFLAYYRQLPVQKLGAQFVGVHENTITNWKKDDQDFYDQIEMAASQWALDNAMAVKSKEWLLERLMNDHFGERKILDLQSGGKPLPIMGHEVIAK